MVTIDESVIRERCGREGNRLMIIYGSITELLFNNIGDIGEIIVSIFVQFQIILIFSTYFRDSIVCKSNINNSFATKNEISRLTSRFLFKFILSKKANSVENYLLRLLFTHDSNLLTIRLIPSLTPGTMTTIISFN